MALVMVSCGSQSGHFKIEGRFLNLNQGELYVYSTNGAIVGIDTIKVDGGRFAYQVPCRDDGTLMLVFPNFSQHPVFAEPGKKVEITADATHLKRMKVKGTKANELMTAFRELVEGMSPPEEKRAAAKFVEDNAASPVAVYLLKRYFATSSADHKEARRLISAIGKEQAGSKEFVKLKNYIDAVHTAAPGTMLPAFSATDVHGRKVSADRLKGQWTLIYTWATWSYESNSLRSQLQNLPAVQQGRLHLVGVCLDASADNLRRQAGIVPPSGMAQQADSPSAAQRRDVPPKSHGIDICDGLMFDGPVVTRLSLQQVPATILVNPQGKIVKRGVKADDEEIRKINGRG